MRIMYGSKYGVELVGELETIIFRFVSKFKSNFGIQYEISEKSSSRPSSESNYKSNSGTNLGSGSNRIKEMKSLKDHIESVRYDLTDSLNKKVGIYVDDKVLQEIWLKLIKSLNKILILPYL